MYDLYHHINDRAGRRNLNTYEVCLRPYPLVFLSRPPPDVRRVEIGYTPVYLGTKILTNSLIIRSSICHQVKSIYHSRILFRV
jgi:hypothetical protein